MSGVQKLECCARVLGNNGWSGHKCTNKAKVERDGRHYCGTHDPEAIKRKRDAQNQKWDEERKAKYLKFQKQQAAEKLRDHKAACFDVLLSEMKRHLCILERAEAMPDKWQPLSVGTGIATLNGYRAAIAKAEATP